MMANEKNLKAPRSTSEARERGKKGGKASGIARREKKTLRESLEALLTMPCEGDPSKTNMQAVAVSLLKEALGGNVPAIKELRDTIGEKPADKLNVDGNFSAEVQIFRIPDNGRN